VLPVFFVGPESAQGGCIQTGQNCVGEQAQMPMHAKLAAAKVTFCCFNRIYRKKM
jgi:hypothetical protein